MRTEASALVLGVLPYEKNTLFSEASIPKIKPKTWLIGNIRELSCTSLKIVKAWVEEHKNKIALFYLPVYSPDLNPDAYLNNDFKRKVNSSHIPINKEELAVNTKNFMSM